ncbi:MAG: hypothetical protein ACLFPX_05750 [Candidatus Omnitrophota bacterium]
MKKAIMFVVILILCAWGTGLTNMWLFSIAIITLTFSACFSAYLSVFYTSSFDVAKGAKITSISLFFISTIMLFMTVKWWCLAGVLLYYVLLIPFTVHWQKRFDKHLAAGTDPWHGTLQEKPLSDNNE